MGSNPSRRTRGAVAQSEEHLFEAQRVVGSIPTGTTRGEDMTTPEENKTIVELRTKLEIRTWFLRASMAFNISFLTGILVYVLTQLL